ncbi:metallophosphoesterase [Haloarchaeobius amylolyticus]|uniref:metallophosphoesterase n=1 Tax=Haloarchaeobius amylolyticus TaxID=1198296 RepID=UPI00226EFD8F|nr:metallophosphoesterase [Haloarchaeobius amylolyticus]
MAATDCSFADRAAYLPAADALVLADLHLGKAHASSVEFPLNEGAGMADRLGGLLDRFDPATVVFAGDVLHSFTTVPVPAREALADLADRVTAQADLRLVSGNHDTQLERVAERVADLPVADAVELDDGTVVCHGHEEPQPGADRYVVGHDHPTIDIEGRTHPCFLYGPGAYRGSDVLVLPAFTTLAAGMTVNRMRGSDFQTPLVTDPDRFHPIVRDESGDETLRFPPLGEFRRLL